MDWSNLQCPVEKLRHCERSADKKENLHKLNTRFHLYRMDVVVKVRLLTLYVSYANTDRNFETCTLQRRDVKFDLKGPAPHYISYDEIFLENRKGWQCHTGDHFKVSYRLILAYSNLTSGNHYNLYDNDVAQGREHL